jgi:release factor glutamine methyltransferase
VTVLEVIQRSSDFLARKGVESPRLQIELLLAHVLQMPRMKLYLNFERPLAGPELETLRSLVKRRGEREPLQHIVGTAAFCGFEIAVNRDVLIPRPETELLAERAVQFLVAAPDSRPSTVLDFGTGSGCLAIFLAKQCPSATVHALDVSEAALRVARENAARHETAERIRFHAGDGFAALPGELAFDLIVSNPPYIPSAEISTLQPEVRDFDPIVALDGGADGLEFYRRLAMESPAFLKPGGRLMLELGDGQAAAAAALLSPPVWTVEAVEKDYSGRERILIARRGD